MNYQEIIAELVKQEISVEDFGYANFGVPPTENNQKNYKKHVVDNIGEVELVEQYGGEDKGSVYYKVYFFKDHNIYIRVDGYYSSYNGADFDGGYTKCCREVVPQTKTITVYK